MIGKPHMGQATLTTNQGRYLADYERLDQETGTSEPAWLRDLRRKAIQRFVEIGFPTARRGNEDWKYTSVAPLASTEFAYPFDATAPQLTRGKVRRQAPYGTGWIELVFVDGHYRQELSTIGDASETVDVDSLANVIARRPDLPREWMGRLVPGHADGFTALSMAFARDGACIRIPRGNTVERPIHLLFLASGEKPVRASYPRTLIIAEEGSASTIVETYAGLSAAPAFTNAVTEVFLGPQAALTHYRLMLEGAGTYHIGTAQVRQAQGSAYRGLSIMSGGLLARHTLGVALEGEGSECNLDGLYMTAGEQHVDNHTFIEHAGPRTSSRELYKGILNGRSRAVFSGRILVQPTAPKTDAHQSNKNLILSKGSEVDTKPFLEIYTNDVRCTHGATAGPVSESDLFFLRARGLDEQRARDLLAFAFASEIVNRIALRPVRARIKKLLLGNLPTLHL